MADDVVDRGADRFRKTAVVERGRDRLVIDDEAVAQQVELAGRHAGQHMRRDEIERRRAELARPAHALERVGAVDLDLPAARPAAREAQACHQVLLHHPMLFSLLHRARCHDPPRPAIPSRKVGSRPAQDNPRRRRLCRFAALPMKRPREWRCSSDPEDRMNEAGPAPEIVTACVADHRQRDPVRAHPGREPRVSRARPQRGRHPAARGAGHPRRCANHHRHRQRGARQVRLRLHHRRDRPDP